MGLAVNTTHEYPDTSLMTPEEKIASQAKPPGSLGELEQWAVCLCKAQKTLTPVADPASVLVFHSDHGVKKANDKVSPFPPSVTQAIFRALAAGISATAVLTKSVGAHLVVVDAGIDGDVSQVESQDSEVTIVHAKIAHGSADITQGPAMTPEILDRALALGRTTVSDVCTSRGAKVVCVGEVGIGNTTVAAALLAGLTGCDAAECCGRGTGLDDAGLQHKISVVRSAWVLHNEAINAQQAVDEDEARRAREALRRLGGLELAAMAGAYMEAAERGVVAIVDGFISAVAAVCAIKLQPSCRHSMCFATNLAEEPSAGHGGEILAKVLEAQPVLSMGLRLGECSAATLALPLLRSAAAMVSHMGSLQEAMALGDS